MAENTKIQWCDHTFNPWRGCTKVHAGCAHCYAEQQSKRNPDVLGVWGDMGTRVVAAESTWGEPVKWNKAAEQAGERRRVFCASLADVFEDWRGVMFNAGGDQLWYRKGGWTTEVGGRQLRMSEVRERLLALIDATPWLDWLLLTKRPENVRRMYVPHLLEKVKGHVSQNEGDGYHIRPRPNVWIGTSISDQETADKYVPELLKLRDLTPCLFLSMEPLLGPVSFRWASWKPLSQMEQTDHLDGLRMLDWVIVGGESGPKARPCRPEWIRSIKDQCQEAAVACFIKQAGGNVITRNDQIEDVFNNGHSGWPDPDVEHHINGFREDYQGADCRIRLRDPKGGDPDEWPEDLRVREFPALIGGAE